MLNIYGNPLSSPANKVCYVANYLEVPYEYHRVNLGSGENKLPTFLKINAFGKIPAIEDDGFCLAESNAIIRYLANKTKSGIYPQDIKLRAEVDKWMDYSSLHVMMALGKIMFNTHFHKIRNLPVDERSLKDGFDFIASYLPAIEAQLTENRYLVDSTMTLADFAMLAALDTCEIAKVSLAPYPHLVAWREKLMAEKFYQSCHLSYAATFNKIMASIA